MSDEPRDLLDAPTRSTLSSDTAPESVEITVLTVLWHPEPSRVGEVAALTGLGSGKSELLERREPFFAQPPGGASRPLADSRLSRKPLTLRDAGAGRVVLERGPLKKDVTVDGRPLGGARTLSRAEVERGVVLVLAKRVVLLLHRTVGVSRRPKESYSLVGESAEMVELRREIERVAKLDIPVLLRGATGTGKELVARALHDHGLRRGRPYVEVNLGAIPRDLASAELFGAARGAFTGADRDRDGYFQRADGGTLFLDEIGEAPPEVQLPLYRVLETGQVQRVGAGRSEHVDVRVVAATDADLEAAVREGRFRSPLLHRLLAAYEIELPLLSERRDDFGRLFVHFLREELTAVAADRLQDLGGWVDPDLVGHLAAYDWPGNVRQLKSAVHQLVVRGHQEQRMVSVPKLERWLRETAPEAAVKRRRAPAKPHRDPEDIDPDEILAVLRRHRWMVSRAAKELGAARASLYKWMDRSPDVRKASELSREEIEQVSASCDGHLDAMAGVLEVSKQALKQRLTKLGLR